MGISTASMVYKVALHPYIVIAEFSTDEFGGTEHIVGGYIWEFLLLVVKRFGLGEGGGRGGQFLLSEALSSQFYQIFLPQNRGFPYIYFETTKFPRAYDDRVGRG